MKAVIFSALALTALAAPAFAECDEAQEAAAGKAIAAATAAAVAKAVAVEGKQMVSINTCDAAGKNATAEFKYNFLGAGGLYWVEGTAKYNGAAVTELKLKRLSPNLAAAEAKAGIKLASN
ncbi:hypothetical protein [Asticcacaulis sp.]|uniref:hypothetical protein n=1 Tax=Asticcacaulis sp. TaxID=1872648 RepID=UPI002614199C|nr:hypothetical protein [Asticcacaulis sp.]